MSKIRWKALFIAACFSLISTSSFGFGDQKDLTLEETIEIAIEKNGDLKLMELNEKKVNDAILTASQGSNNANFFLNQFYDYARLYEVGGPNIQKYKNMSQQTLIVNQAAIVRRLMMEPNMPEALRNQLLEEEQYINYIFMFGNKKPELSDEDKYRNFVKNRELPIIMAENEKVKFDNNRKLIESTISGEITKLYINYVDFENNIRMQNENLKFYERQLEDYKALYESGMISKNTLLDFEDELDKIRLNIENLKMQFENLEYTLKKQISMPMDEKINVIDYIDKTEDITLLNIKTYVEKAKESNINYMNLLLDLKLKETELNLYNKYINTYSRERENLLSDIKLLKLNLETIEKEIVSNVYFGVEDIIQKKEELKEQELSLNIAKENYFNGKENLKLGLIKKTDLNGLELQYIGAIISKSQKERSIKSSSKRFELLIEDGVTY